MDLIYNPVTLYSMSSSTLTYLKLETILYTSMYSLFTLLCMNGEHLTSQWKSFSYADSQWKGYGIDTIDWLNNLNVRLYNSE